MGEAKKYILHLFKDLVFTFFAARIKD